MLKAPCLKGKGSELPYLMVVPPKIHQYKVFSRFVASVDQVQELEGRHG
jgi:hypothetical protein